MVIIVHIHDASMQLIGKSLERPVRNLIAGKPLKRLGAVEGNSLSLEVVSRLVMAHYILIGARAWQTEAFGVDVDELFDVSTFQRRWFWGRRFGWTTRREGDLESRCVIRMARMFLNDICDRNLVEKLEVRRRREFGTPPLLFGLPC